MDADLVQCMHVHPSSSFCARENTHKQLTCIMWATGSLVSLVLLAAVCAAAVVAEAPPPYSLERLSLNVIDPKKRMNGPSLVKLPHWLHKDARPFKWVSGKQQERKAAGAQWRLEAGREYQQKNERQREKRRRGEFSESARARIEMMRFCNE